MQPRVGVFMEDICGSSPSENSRLISCWYLPRLLPEIAVPGLTYPAGGSFRRGIRTIHMVGKAVLICSVRPGFSTPSMASILGIHWCRHHRALLLWGYGRVLGFMRTHGLSRRARLTECCALAEVQQVTGHGDCARSREFSE